MFSVQILAGCLIKLILLITLNNAVMLLEQYPYSKFFWSVFSRIWTEYGEIRTPYSLRIRENAEQKDSECGHFSRIVTRSYKLTPNFNCCLFSQCSIVGTFEICLSGNLVNKSEKTRNYAKICLLYWTSLSELGNFLSPWSLQNILDFLIISERIDTMWFSQFTWFQNVRQAV